MAKGRESSDLVGGQAASSSTYSSTRGSGRGPVGRPLPGSAELPRVARPPLPLSEAHTEVVRGPSSGTARWALLTLRLHRVDDGLAGRDAAEDYVLSWLGLGIRLGLGLGLG